MVVNFSTVLGKLYLVERNDTYPLGPWVTVATNVAGTGVIVPVTDTGGAGLATRVYRVQVLP